MQDGADMPAPIRRELRHVRGAATTVNLDHGGLRAHPVIAKAGVAITTVPAEEAAEIMAGDPCVRAGMMRCEVYACHGFPGDALPV
jgi:hypothetical protein